MSTPLTISFVVPIYKIERIRKQFDTFIQSLLTQTYPHTEIIFVNDASPDNSADILQDLADQHSHIRIVTHSHNQGQGPARNSGAVVATGDYIWFVDQDDFVVSNACQVLLDEAQTHDLPDIIYFDTGSYSEENLEASISQPSELTDYADYYKSRRARFKMEFYLLIFYQRRGTPWRQIAKADLARASKFPDFYPEDIVQTLGTIVRAQRILYVNAALYYWRPHELSTSATIATQKNIEGHIKAVQKMREIAQDFAHKKELHKFTLCREAFWTMVAFSHIYCFSSSKSEMRKFLDELCPNRWSAYLSVLYRYSVSRMYQLRYYLANPPTTKRFPAPVYYVGRIIQLSLPCSKAAFVLLSLKVCPWRFCKLARRSARLSDVYRW